MKIKILLTLFLSCALGLSAQGYLDGIDYYRADQYGNARTIFERTLNDADTDKAVSYYYLGQLAIMDGELDKALEYFNKGIEVNPNYAYNYVGLALLDLKKGDKKSAENYIKQAKKLDKKNAALYVEIARAYYDTNKDLYQKDIQKSLKESYKISIEEPSYYLFVGDTIIVNATNNRELGDAAAYYDQAITYAPNSAYTVVKYSGLYEKLNPSLAISSMRKFLATNPNSALAQRELAERLYNQKMYTEAAVEYGKYIKMPSHFAEDEQRYAILLHHGGNYAEAFEVAKNIAPKLENPFFMDRMLFYTKLELKDYTEAYNYANIFFKKYPDPQYLSDGDYIRYATIARECAKIDTANANAYIDSAIVKYKALIVKNPKASVAYKSLADIYSSRKDYLNAITYSEQYIGTLENPKDVDYESLALYLCNQSTIETDEVKKKEYQDRAIAAILKAVENTKDPYVARTAGRIYYIVQGEYTADFEKYYLKSLELLDADEFYAQKAQGMYTHVLYALGVYYYQQNDNVKAKEMFMRYLQFDPNNAKINDIVKQL